MAAQITSEQRSAWLSAAAAAGLGVDDDRDELLEKAKGLGLDVHWVIPRGLDVRGVEHEKFMAYLGNSVGDYGGLLSADSVEEAIRLIVGEALVGRALQEDR